MKKMLLMLIGALLAAAGAGAFERVYTLGDKINGSKQIVLATVVEVRELMPGKKTDDGAIVGDYLYRLRVRELLKGKNQAGEILVVQSPEYRKDRRCYQQDSLVIAFLTPNSLSGRFRAKYKLGQQQCYENYAQRQGTVAIDDSAAALYAQGIKGFLAAKQAKKKQRMAKWAALLDLNIPDLKESALSEMMGTPYYPAKDAFIKCLVDDNLTAYATKNLLQLAPDSLADRLDMLLLLQKTDSRRVKVNLLKLVAPLQDDRVFKLLQQSLKDDNFEIRATAAKGLEHWSGKKAVKSLKKALGDEDDYVRNAAYEALTKQGFAIEKKEDGYYRITKEPKK
jgi:hypothetical protein